MFSKSFHVIKRPVSHINGVVSIISPFGAHPDHRNASSTFTNEFRPWRAFNIVATFFFASTCVSKSSFSLFTCDLRPDFHPKRRPNARKFDSLRPQLQADRRSYRIFSSEATPTISTFSEKRRKKRISHNFSCVWCLKAKVFFVGGVFATHFSFKLIIFELNRSKQSDKALQIFISYRAFLFPSLSNNRLKI